MQRKITTLALALPFLLFPLTAAKAKEPVATVAKSTRTADEEAVRAATQAFAQAFQTGNEKAVAALFTDEAEYVDEGSEPVHGREALAKAYSRFFAKKQQVRAEAKTSAIRFLGTDTALEEGTFTVTQKDGPASANRYSALHVRQDGKWLIAMLKEWEDEETEQPKLQDLSWLIGTWESSSPEVTAKTTYSWTSNKAFIRADFTITPKKDGEKPSSGTQIIGVDPAVGQIRAWLFAEDGGIGESNWVWDGERWMIESVGTLADGSSTSAVNILSRTGDGEFSWRSVQRHEAGEVQPDLPAITVKRTATDGSRATR